MHTLIVEDDFTSRLPDPGQYSPGLSRSKRDQSFEVIDVHCSVDEYRMAGK